MHVLALDVGTSSVKAAVLDAVAAAAVGPVARVGYELDRPTPDAAEVRAECLWVAVAEAARAATRDAPDVQGVGLSCMAPMLALLDKGHRPVRPFWTHLDRRARPAARQTWGAAGPEFLRTTGNRPLPGGVSVICFRQQLEADPYLGHDVRHYLHANGWLALRLTGETAFDPGNASYTGLFNTLTDRRWSAEWCDFFEAEMGWLPPVVEANATVGTVRAAVAAELGVPAGVPLKLGPADTGTALLAAGARAGDLLHAVGATQTLETLTDSPQPGRERRTRLLGVGSAYVHATHNPVGGAALAWLRRLCFRDQGDEEFYGRTVPEALGRETRVTLDPAYLGGDPLEIEAQRAGFRDLTITTDRLDLLAAVLGAMARCHRKALRDLGAGECPGRVFLTGAGAELMRRLLPEYATADVQLLPDASLLGVARLFHPAG